MTDLHTHILPGMDDGAKNLRTALTLLEQQALQGVNRIALTSHYHGESEPLETFLERREAAFSALSSRVPEGMSFKLGCEVFFSPQLLRVEAEQLCLEGTNVLLLELPVLQKPAFLKEVLASLCTRGIVPLIAHVERYAYVMKEPALLAEWKELGALIQVNAASVIDGNRLAMKLIRWDLADVLASDAHSAQRRPPNLKRGLDTIAKALSSEKSRELEHNARRIFSGKEIPKRQIHVPQKVLGIWV